MARQLPVREAQLLDFARSHAPLWLERHEQIGLSESLAERHADEAGALEQAAVARAAAELALRVARDAYNRAEEAYRLTASGCIRFITSFATTDAAANPDAVFIAADLNTPRRPDRNRPPAQPESLRASLDTVTGVLTLEWECRNPRTVSGTVYLVRRRISPLEPWAELGHVSRPRFVDALLPQGAATVEYQVTARRASLIGDPSTPLFVRLGGGASVEPPAIVVHPARAA